MFVRTLRYWIPVIVWMAFIFWMSTNTFSSPNTASILEPVLYFILPSLPSEDIAWIHHGIRKLAHVTEYLILGILLFRAFKAGSAEERSLRWAAYSLLVVVLYAASDEYHQSFLDTRTASLVDVGFDSFGGFLGQCICFLCYGRYRLH